MTSHGFVDKLKFFCINSIEMRIWHRLGKREPDKDVTAELKLKYSFQHHKKGFFRMP